MTAAPVRDAVRRACDATWTHTKCVWPDCSCLFDGSGEQFLVTLIAQARAEERERAVQACSAIAAELTGQKPALASVAWRCVTAIRARTESGTEGRTEG